MVPIASFGAGPSGVELALAMVVAGLVAAALGYGNRSIVLGSVGGGLGGVFIYWLLISVRGSFLGAEVPIPAFGLGGALIGGLAGAVARSRGPAGGEEARRRPSDGDRDA
jgi:hypothetical protein